MARLFTFFCVWCALLFTGCERGKPESETSKAGSPAVNWGMSRTWVSADGRTMEGALVARKGPDGIIQRATDGRLMRMPPKLLGEEGRTFLTQALASGQIGSTHPSAWYLKTRLTIPGGEALMPPDTVVAVGPRIAKVETSYWLLLCELDESKAMWARVDNHAFSKVGPDSIVMRSELASQINGSGTFIDQVACPRTDLYVIDAKYGLTSRRINVTRFMMSHVANGVLPVKVTPELFGQPSHAPDVWDVTITWQRYGDSTLNRVVRDESILAWP